MDCTCGLRIHRGGWKSSSRRFTAGGFRCDCWRGGPVPFASGERAGDLRIGHERRRPRRPGKTWMSQPPLRGCAEFAGEIGKTERLALRGLTATLRADCPRRCSGRRPIHPARRVALVRVADEAEAPGKRAHFDDAAVVARGEAREQLADRSRAAGRSSASSPYGTAAMITGFDRQRCRAWQPRTRAG